jgi:hypothetical protein
MPTTPVEAGGNGPWDLFTWGFGDQQRLYTRGQWTAHRNAPKVWVGSLARGCLGSPVTKRGIFSPSTCGCVAPLSGEPSVARLLFFSGAKPDAAAANARTVNGQAAHRGYVCR